MTQTAFYSRLIPLLFSLLLGWQVAHGTCDVPTALRTSNPTSSTITVEWNAVSGASTYQYMYREVDSGGGWTSSGTSNTYVGLTSLSASTTYEFQVRAYCGSTAGFSSFTDIIYFSTGSYFSPDIVTVPQPTANSAYVMWSSIEDAESYEIAYKKNTDLSWTTTTSDKSIINLTGLDVGEDYNVRVRSVYSGPNYSDYSVIVDFTTGACAAPTLSTISNIGASWAWVLWTYDEPAINYEVRYRLYTDMTWTTVDSIDADSIQLTGLDASSLYVVQVRAVCDTTGDTSSYSSPGLFSTGSCGLPTSLALSNVGYSTAEVNWDAGTNAESYEVRYKTVAGDWDTIPADEAYLLLENLTPDTKYYVQVRSYCGGNEYSAFTVSDSLETLECTGADTVALDSVSFAYAAVHWADKGAPLGYEVEIKPVSDTVWRTIVAADSLYIFNNMTPGEEYHLRVRSWCDSITYSSWTDTLSFTMDGCPSVDSLTVSDISYTTAHFAWPSVAEAEEYMLAYVRVGGEAQWTTVLTQDTVVDVSSLESGVRYKAQVFTACEHFGYSLATPDSGLYFQTDGCPMPDTVIVDSVGYTAARVYWPAVADAADGYMVSYRRAGSAGNWLEVASDDTVQVLTGLETTMQYEVRVLSVCDSAVHSFIAVADTFSTDTCTTPDSLWSSVEDFTTVTLTWLEVDGSIGYEISWETPGEDPSTYALSDTSITIDTLQPGKRYIWRVRNRCDSLGYSAWTDAGEFTMMDCVAPAGLTRIDESDSTVTLRWNGVDSVQKYEVCWRPMGTESWTCDVTTDTTYDISSLDSCTRYETKVRVKCDTANSIISDYATSYYAATTGSGCWLTPLPLTYEYDPTENGWLNDGWTLNDAAIDTSSVTWVDRYGFPRQSVDLSGEDHLDCGGFKLYFADAIANNEYGFDDTTSLAAEHASGATTIGELRQNCLCAAFQQAAAKIYIGEATPEIYIRLSDSVGLGALGASSAFYKTTGAFAFRGGSVLDYIQGATDTVSGYDGWMRYDFGTRTDTASRNIHADWYLAPPDEDLDFYSVAQHHVYKLLGFATLMNEAGESMAGGKYSLMDYNWQFISTSDSTDLQVLSAAGEPAISSALTQECVYYRPAGETVQKNIFTPLAAKTFLPGLSFSGLQQPDELNEFAVTAYTQAGQSPRLLSAAEEDVLCDFGYVLAYSICQNAYPVGVEDELTAQIDEVVEFNLLSNDFDADGNVLDFEESFTPRLVQGDGILTCEDKTCTFFPAPGFTGEAVVLYQPTDGQRKGLITKGRVIYDWRDVARYTPPHDARCADCDATSPFLDGQFNLGCTRLLNWNNHQFNGDFWTDLTAQPCGTNLVGLASPYGAFMITDQSTFPTPNNRYRYPSLTQCSGDPACGQYGTPFQPDQQVMLCDLPTQANGHNSQNHPSNSGMRTVLWAQILATPVIGDPNNNDARGTYCFSAWVASAYPEGPSDPVPVTGVYRPRVFLAVARTNGSYEVFGNELFPFGLGSNGNRNIVADQPNAAERIVRNQWQRLNAVFTIPPDDPTFTYQFAIVVDYGSGDNLRTGTGGGGDVLIDGVRLERVEDPIIPPTPTELVVGTPPNNIPRNGSYCRPDVTVRLPITMVRDQSMDHLYAHELRARWGVTVLDKYNNPVVLTSTRVLGYSDGNDPDRDNNPLTDQLFISDDLPVDPALYPLRVDIQGAIGLSSASDANGNFACPWSKNQRFWFYIGGRPDVTLALTNPDCGESTGIIGVTVNDPILATGNFYNYVLLDKDGGTLASETPDPIEYTHDFTDLSAGTYTVSVTATGDDQDNPPCPYVQTVTLDNLAVEFLFTPPCPVSSVPLGGTPAPLGIIGFTITGGTPNYTVTLIGPTPHTLSNFDGLTSVSWNDLMPGNYLLEISDGAGCFWSSGLISLVNSRSYTAYPIAATCSNSTDGAVALILDGFVGPTNWVWGTDIRVLDVTTGADVFPIPQSPPNNPIMVYTGLRPGNYRFLIRDNSSGCPWDIFVTIPSRNPLLTGTITLTGCATPTNQVTLTAQVTGGIAPYTYAWNTNPPGAVQSAAVTVSVGQAPYTVLVTDNAGCTATFTRTVTQTDLFARDAQRQFIGPNQLPYRLVNLAGSPCNSTLIVQRNWVVPNGAYLAFMADPATPGSPPGGNWLQMGLNPDAALVFGFPTGFAPGNYTLYIQDANGCQETLAVVLSGLSNLNVTAVPANCGQANNGALDVTAQNPNFLSTQAQAGLYEYELNGNGTWYQLGAGASWVATPPPGFVRIQPLATGSYTVRARLIGSSCSTAVSNPATTINAAGTITCASDPVVQYVCQGNTLNIPITSIAGGGAGSLTFGPQVPMTASPDNPDPVNYLAMTAAQLNNLIQINNQGTPSLTFNSVLNPPSANGVTDVAFSGNPFGTYAYNVQVVDAAGCTQTCPLQVNVCPRPQLDQLSQVMAADILINGSPVLPQVGVWASSLDPQFNGQNGISWELQQGGLRVGPVRANNGAFSYDGFGSVNQRYNLLIYDTQTLTPAACTLDVCNNTYNLPLGLDALTQGPPASNLLGQTCAQGGSATFNYPCPVRIPARNPVFNHIISPDIEVGVLVSDVATKLFGLSQPIDLFLDNLNGIGQVSWSNTLPAGSYKAEWRATDPGNPLNFDRLANLSPTFTINPPANLQLSFGNMTATTLPINFINPSGSSDCDISVTGPLPGTGPAGTPVVGENITNSFNFTGTFATYSCYQVTVVDNQRGCTTTATVCRGARAESPSLTLQSFVRVYPNPARDAVTVEYDLQSDAELVVTDVLGRQVGVWKLADTKGNLEMNVQDWAGGVYYGAFRNGGKTLHSFRLAVSH